MPPLTRTLPAVLRDALNPEPGLALLVGRVAATVNNAYVDVTINATTVRVPRLYGTRVVVGEPAYLLSSGDALLYIGTCSAA
jgi:hypothetical protein